MNHPLSQLSFDFIAPSDYDLDSYFWARNVEFREWVMTALKNQSSTKQFVYVYGPSGSGVTHLLKGFSAQLEQMKSRSIYLPLRALSNYPNYFGLWEGMDWVILDDIEFVENDYSWQERMMAFYESIIYSQTHVLIGAHCASHQLDIELLDLKSRLLNFWQYKLEPLSDKEKRQCLDFIIKRQGLAVDSAVLEYLMTRGCRDIGQMLAVLKSAESLALIKKNKITVPMIRSAMSGG